jgi:hypothetical protein
VHGNIKAKLPNPVWSGGSGGAPACTGMPVIPLGTQCAYTSYFGTVKVKQWNLVERLTQKLPVCIRRCYTCVDFDSLPCIGNSSTAIERTSILGPALAVTRLVLALLLTVILCCACIYTNIRPTGPNMTLAREAGKQRSGITAVAIVPSNDVGGAPHQGYKYRKSCCYSPAQFPSSSVSQMSTDPYTQTASEKSSLSPQEKINALSVSSRMCCRPEAVAQRLFRLNRQACDYQGV